MTPVRYNKLYVRTGRSTRRKQVAREPQKFPIWILALVGGAMLVLLGRVYLERETIRMGMEWEQKRRRLNALSRETENLRIERESYLRGDYILARAQQLGLVKSQPGQVRLMRSPQTDDNPVLAAAHPRR